MEWWCWYIKSRPGQESTTSKMTVKTFLHRGSTISRRISHDYTFRDTCNTITFPECWCVKQMVCRLFERCKHKYAVFHFCYTKSCDSENFPLWLQHMCPWEQSVTCKQGAYLIGHNITEEHYMSERVTLSSLLERMKQTYRGSILMPWDIIVYWISLMIVLRAASIPSTPATSIMWFDDVCSPTMPSVIMTFCSP